MYDGRAISREELREKPERRDDFFLVEILLSAAAFELARLQSPINLRPDRVGTCALTAARQNAGHQSEFLMRKRFAVQRHGSIRRFL
jgi:hypothetical protein